MSRTSLSLTIQNMISIMLSKIPEDRPTFDRILSAFRGTIFPEYFYIFLEDYCNSLSELPERSEKAFLQKTASQPGNKIDRLLEEWESITVHLEGTGGSSGALCLESRLIVRWTRIVAIKHRNVFPAELDMAIIAPARSATLPQPMSIPLRRRQGGSHRPLHRGALGGRRRSSQS